MKETDQIENYIDITPLGNDQYKLRPPIKESNIYKKLHDLGYSFESQDKFIKRNKYADERINKIQLLQIFMDYIYTLDISQYPGLEHEDIYDAYIGKNIIRQNGLMKRYMPM